MGKRVMYLDVLKTLAIIGIITTHTSGAITSSITFNDLWITGAFYDAMTRYGVPLFIIVTGSLTLGKEINIISFIGKFSLGIYVIHILIRDIFITNKTDLHHIFNLIHTPYIGVFLNSMIVLSFSSLAIYILSKIPILKRLI